MEKTIRLIFGKRGSGKSYLLAYLVRAVERLIIYDTLHEYYQGLVFTDFAKLAKFWLHNYKGNFRLIYRPTDPAAEFELIAEMVWLCGDLVFAVEEIDVFGTPYKIGTSFASIIQRGRHKRIELIGITQRPFGIHRLLTSQAKEICIFNTNEPRDREYLRNLLGKEIEPQLDSLGEYEYLRWEDGSGIEKAKVGADIDEKNGKNEKISGSDVAPESAGAP